MNITKSNQLVKYINNKYIPSIKVNKFDPIINLITLDI